MANQTIKPKDSSFNIKSKGFYLDGRLTAVVEDKSINFMGREIFTTGFFRDNIGFGITNVDIELNTNLHPLITITLKDLYGNLMFGKENVNYNTPNYKVLFNWPPPKFLFTFKGYLGRQVTWLLTLKSTSTTYQSDGSYDIKCEFLPNQWGFMSDLPFLFLLAVKGLRKKDKDNSEFKKVQSVFDLIKIGRKVEVKTQEVSAEFDVLKNQLTLIKSGRIVEALTYSRVIRFDEPIDGTYGKFKVTKSGDLNFSTITFRTPPDTRINSLEKIKAYTIGNADALRRVNTYLLLNAEFQDVKNNFIHLDDINFDNGQFYEEKVRERTYVINNNIKIVDDAIKSKIYQSSKYKLSQITIGEIFKQIAKDSGYLMGRILKAGEEGYLENKSLRDEAVENESIINKYYPLEIVKEERDEVPALGSKYGTENYEMAFVNEFIAAVSEGVAKDLTQVNFQKDSVNQENVLVKRINNVEGPKGNPYKPFLRNIAQNILIRSGIIAFLTRSNDPNYPGDYENTVKAFGIDTGIGVPIDRDSIDEVLKLATADMENITTEMLSQLDDTETVILKHFCTFWKNFCTEDGQFFLPPTNQTVSVFDIIPRNEFNKPINSIIAEKRIVVDEASKQTKTLEDVMAIAFGPINKSNTSATAIDNSNASFIDFNAYQSQVIYNNGILYRVPIASKESDKYTFVLFEGSDSVKVREVVSSDSDSEARNADADDGNLLGYVPIDTYYGSDNKKLGRIDFMQERLKVAVLNYSSISNPPRQAWFSETDWMNACVYPTDTMIIDTNTANLSSGLEKKIFPFNITVSVAFHPSTTDRGLLFGPFYNSQSGRNHLACIKNMCVNVLSKFEELEKQKNKIVSDILGKAEEGKNAIYKQFNILYHQWETLILKNIDNSDAKYSYDKLGVSEIVNNLEERFGADSQHKTPNPEDRKGDILTYDNCTFVYDYPLNNTAKLNVKNSIINIEPLYRPDGNTSVLNIIQQVCEKNNFMFIPVPGNADFNNCVDIFTPQITTEVQLKNLFYIMFSPTPESRIKLDNKEKSALSQSEEVEVVGDVMEVQIGSPYNKIFKSIDIETYENKTTAESIINLQRLTDNENQNKVIPINCSLLPIMEGRSCKTTFEMIGNAQIFPMQYFYLNSIPLFNGLYQTLKVNHSITPNDMTTKAQGVRMRFGPGNSGGVQPITLESLAKEGVFFEKVENKENLTDREVFAEDDFNPAITRGIEATGGNKGVAGNFSVSQKRPKFTTQKKENINLLISQMKKDGITNEFTQAAILSIIYKESGFIPLNENLFYKAERIRQVWPSTSKADSLKYAENPKAFGDWRYGKEGGNNGEGYKYRGRGFNQITFKNTYKSVGKEIGVDLVSDPDKLQNPKYAAMASIVFFKNGIRSLSTEKLMYYNNETKNLNGFTTLEGAVGGIYHINAGVGKSIKNVLGDTTGGRKKAFSVSEYMLEIVKAGKIN